MNDPLVVNVSHDEREGTWHVLSSDVPGLHAEAESLDALIEIISDFAPDLISANISDWATRYPAGLSLLVQHKVSINRAHAA
jgi:hypothetical protein